jgi:hypothetical protein
MEKKEKKEKKGIYIPEEIWNQIIHFLPLFECRKFMFVTKITNKLAIEYCEEIKVIALKHLVPVRGIDFSICNLCQFSNSAYGYLYYGYSDTNRHAHILGIAEDTGCEKDIILFIYSLMKHDIFSHERYQLYMKNTLRTEGIYNFFFSN